MRIIGWGTQLGKPYWLVANTWGTKWGLEGFVIAFLFFFFFACKKQLLDSPYAFFWNRTFKIMRGTNECGFEDRVAAALPVLS